MFNNLHLKGFKSFIDNNIELKPLTVLTGLNSCGKSSVIQAIRMIENIANNNSPLLEGYGNFDELHSNFTRSEMLIELSDDNFTFWIKNEKNSEDYTASDYKNNQNLSKIIYIGANRIGAQPSLTISLQNKVGDRGENVLSVLDHYAEQGVSLDERLKPDTAQGLTFDYVVTGWLQYISPGVHFEYKVDRKADLSYSTFNGNRATNVGFGLSYTLPIIVALLSGTINKDNVVLIENPEAHLHPRGQTKMAELIARCVECGAQVIVETHSDHLFDGIRIFTKHNPGFNDKVIAHWFQLDNANNSQVQTIKLTEEGRFPEVCPEGFFDQFEINADELLF